MLCNYLWYSKCNFLCNSYCWYQCDLFSLENWLTPISFDCWIVFCMLRHILYVWLLVSYDMYLWKQFSFIKFGRLDTCETIQLSVYLVTMWCLVWCLCHGSKGSILPPLSIHLSPSLSFHMIQPPPNTPSKGREGWTGINLSVYLSVHRKTLSGQLPNFWSDFN